MNARGVPIDLAAGLIRSVLPIARTWRFRHPDDPGRPIAPRLARGVHATWHEHLLPLAVLLADQGIGTLASRDHDGEIVARILSRLGYVPARGSSSRSGSSGFRQLLRAARAGRSIVLTPDGPRGPRRVCKPGTAHLSRSSGEPLFAIGVAATHGWRLRSWDRFLIPAPGATVFVSIAEVVAETGPSSAALERALAGEVDRCVQAAREARWSRPPRVRRHAAGPLDRAGAPGPRSPGIAAGVTRGIERRVRASWTGARPAAWLRPAAAAFSLTRDLRHALYDVGLLTTVRAPLPVVSVGGATIGGSGKTPVTSEIARLLGKAGHRVAILTRGYADEMALHRRWRPEAMVWGHPDRARLAARAFAEGATVAVLDDGFQHRRLGRDVELLLIDRDALRRTSGAALPAGPFRERWRSAVRRAHVVLFTGREPWSAEVAAFDARLRETLAQRHPELLLAALSLEASPPRPVNEAARAAGGGAGPSIALTGIMKPNLFFDLARAHCPSIRVELALPDHGLPSSGQWSELCGAAAPGGILLTQKDLPRLEHLLPAALPLWVLPERLVWRAGEAEVLAYLRRTVPAPRAGGDAAAGRGGKSSVA